MHLKLDAQTLEECAMCNSKILAEISKSERNLPKILAGCKLNFRTIFLKLSQTRQIDH